MASAVLCVDIGTSSLKAAIIDRAGNVLSYSRQPFILYNTFHAALEWEGALKKAASAFLSPPDSPLSSVDALCISGNGPTIVSEEGETLLWNVDTASFFHNKYEGHSLFIPRILAFKERFPLAWQKACHIFSGPEFLIYKLTGKAVSILPEERYEDAYWSSEALVKEGLLEEEIKKLPPFVFPGSLAGTLLPNIAKEFSIKEGTPVYTGAPDFISALVGTDTLYPGRICDRAGSSEGINICTTAPVSAGNIRTLPSVIKDLWNVSFLIARSGVRFSEYKQKVERERGSEVPFASLVADILDSNGEEALLEQGKYLMIQTALNVKDGLFALHDALKNASLFAPCNFMTVTGGQANNDLWNQMKSDILGIEIRVPHCTDAELIGDAAFTFCGLGEFNSLRDATTALCRVEKVFSPRY